MESLSDITRSGVSAFSAGGGTSFPQMSSRWYAWTDCESAVTASGAGDWQAAVSGTGASMFAISTVWATNVFGACALDMGTTATGAATLRTASQTVLTFGLGAAKCRTRFNIPQLSTATNNFTIRAGFITSAASDSANGAYFRYNHGVNTGKFQAVTRNNNAETAVDTGITAAANTDYKFDIEVNADGTSAVFKINGTTVATITTNIPTGTNRTGIGIGCVKSAGTTALVGVQVDYIEGECILTTAR